MSNQASPGDTNNALLRKILSSIAGAVSDGVLEANRPRPGDTDNVLLRKILTLLAFGTASGTTDGGTPAAPVLAGEGAPTSVSGVEGDVFIDLVNGDVYIFEGDTWVLQSSTIGNTWTTDAGDPSDANGRDGDYYLDGITGRLWVKSGESWGQTDIVFEFAPVAGGLPYAASVNLNFDYNTSVYLTLNLTGDVTFTTSNRASARAKAVRIIADGSDRNFTFPAGWVWVGLTPPATIAANKTAILSVTCFGADDTDIVATYAVEA